MPEDHNPSAKSVTAGIALTTTLYGIQTVLQMGFTAVLARLLLPREFGVVAAAMVFITFTRLFSEIGIAQTVVQLPALNDRMLRVAYGIVLCTSALFFGFGFLLAPLAAAWFRQPELVDVIRALAFVFVIQAQSILPQNLLFRRLKAPTVMTHLLIAMTVADAFVAIPMAAFGWSYWSLVTGTLVQEMLFAILLTSAISLPRLPIFSWTDTKTLLDSSVGFAMARIMAFFAMNGDNMIVGRYMSTSALGIYSRAFTLANMPSIVYGQVVDRVVFPAIARVQGDPARVKGAYLRGISLTALVGIPLAVAVVLLAPELIRVLLGPHWMAAIIPFQILSLAIYTRLGSRVNGSLQRGTGAVRQLATLQFVAALTTIGGTLLTYRYGLHAVSAAIAAGIAFNWALSSFFACRLVRASFAEFAAGHIHGAIMGVFVGLVIYACLLGARSLGLTALPSLLFAFVITTPLVLSAVLLNPRALLGEAGSVFFGHLREALIRRFFARTN